MSALLYLGGYLICARSVYVGLGRARACQCLGRGKCPEYFPDWDEPYWHVCGPCGTRRTASILWPLMPPLIVLVLALKAVRGPLGWALEELVLLTYGSHAIKFHGLPLFPTQRRAQ